MLKPKTAFSGFSVNDQAKAKSFYSGILGLNVEDGKMGLIIHLPEGGEVFVYEKSNHEPATYTVLNIDVDSIDQAVEELKNCGIDTEKYEGMHQGEDGIVRGKAANMGPDIAWIKDPAGNIIGIIER